MRLLAVWLSFVKSESDDQAVFCTEKPVAL